MTLGRILRWVLLIAIIAIMGALAWWYQYLKDAQSKSAATAAARGLNEDVPTFSGDTGSTDQNMASVVKQESSDTGAMSGTVNTRLWQISSVPVAGYAFTSQSMITFVARSTGYVFTANPPTRTIVRQTNTLQPKIYSAYVGQDGYIIERSIDADGNATTFVSQITAASTTAPKSSPSILAGKMFDPNIGALAVNPATHEIVYTTTDASGATSGYTSQWDGSAGKRLFTSPMSGWNIAWLSDGRIILWQKPADNTSGYAFTLQKDGSLAKLLGPQFGLNILPSNGSSAVLVSSSVNGTVSLYALASTTAEAKLLPIATVTDKCAWAPADAAATTSRAIVAFCAVPSSAPKGNYINDWYRGAVHTQDEWWKVDVKAGTAEKVFGAGDDGYVGLDAIDPTIDSTGASVAFRNAEDDSLWVLKLNATP